jgi:asparagine synthase (glutamine-hydrolysing)
MLSTLLRDADQMSMAHGLELRVPFVDHVLVENVLPILSDEKYVRGAAKGLLMSSLSDLLPPLLRERRKRGFNLPFEYWFRRELKESINTCFTELPLNGPWDSKTFRTVWQNFNKGKVSWSRVMSLYVLENWLQKNGIRA